jgi:hypothetical protein
MLEALLLPFALMLAIKMGSLIFLSPRDLPRYPAPYAALHLRLRLAGGLMLAVGLGAATSIQMNLQSAPEDNSDIIGYEVEAGHAYPIRAAQSKRYNAQIERTGGKSAVFINDFSRWVGNPWRRGGKLPTVLLFISVGGFVIVCFILASF